MFRYTAESRNSSARNINVTFYSWLLLIVVCTSKSSRVSRIISALRNGISPLMSPLNDWSFAKGGVLVYLIFARSSCYLASNEFERGSGTLSRSRTFLWLVLDRSLFSSYSSNHKHMWQMCDMDTVSYFTLRIYLLYDIVQPQSRACDSLQ